MCVAFGSGVEEGRVCAPGDEMEKRSLKRKWEIGRKMRVGGKENDDGSGKWLRVKKKMGISSAGEEGEIE